MLQVHFGYLLQLDFLGVSPEWVLYVALHLPNPLGRPHLREDVVCELLSRTVGQWIGDESRTEFFAETLGIPSRWIAGAEALWHRHAHDRQNEFDACLRAGAIAEAYQIFSSVLGPEAFAKECGAIGHAFASADCADLRAKIEVLQRRRAGLHKDQQHELDLYSRFLGVLDDHRAGSGGAGGSSGGGTSFGDFFRHFSGNLTPRASGKGEPSPFWAVAQKNGRHLLGDPQAFDLQRERGGRPAGEKSDQSRRLVKHCARTSADSHPGRRGGHLKPVVTSALCLTTRKKQ